MYTGWLGEGARFGTSGLQGRENRFAGDKEKKDEGCPTRVISRKLTFSPSERVSPGKRGMN